MIDRLIEWLMGNIDKVCHYLICVLISLLITLTMGLIFGIPLWISGIIGLIIGIVAGVIKEIYDSRHKGKFDKKDLIADIFGSISDSVL